MKAVSQSADQKYCGFYGVAYADNLTSYKDLNESGIVSDYSEKTLHFYSMFDRKAFLLLLGCVRVDDF